MYLRITCADLSKCFLVLSKIVIFCIRMKQTAENQCSLLKRNCEPRINFHITSQNRYIVIPYLDSLIHKLDERGLLRESNSKSSCSPILSQYHLNKEQNRTRVSTAIYYTYFPSNSFLDKWQGRRKV